MSELIFRNWNNREIRQRADGYLSATDMCASCGKQFSEWKRLRATIEDLQALESVMGIPQDELINIIQEIITTFFMYVLISFYYYLRLKLNF